MTKIERRRVLGAGLAAAAGGASVLAAPAVRAQAATIEATLVAAWPKGAPGVGTNAERYARRLETMSGGRIKVTFYGAGELVPPFECLDAVEQGTADLAHATPYYWVGKSKALNYFTGVPFGLTAVEFAAWYNWGDGRALWQEVYEPFGVIPFYVGSSGTQAGGWFNREINTLADFEGLKFRIAGLGGEVMKRLGVTPVLMPPGEIFAAMSSGAVDGADWVGPWNDIAFGLQKVAKYYYMPGFHEPGPGLEVIVNRGFYEGLPDDLKAIVEEAAQATAMDTLADFTFHNVQTFAEMEEKFGIQLRSFPDDVVLELGKVSMQVLDELGKSDPLTAKVHASYMDFLAKARAYSPYAEEGVLRMRTMAG